MNKAFSLSMNEAGSVIIYTLIILTLLTFIGLVSIRNANTEIEIAGTELVYQRNFYLAEGAAMEAVRWMDNNPITDLSGPSWMEMTTGAMDTSTIDDYWAGTEAVQSQTSAIDGAASFLAAYEGLAGGSSLDVGKTKLHDITIYGRSTKSGVAEVRLGYRKAF
jgi:hypothetical protein